MDGVRWGLSYQELLGYDGIDAVLRRAAGSTGRVLAAELAGRGG